MENNRGGFPDKSNIKTAYPVLCFLPLWSYWQNKSNKSSAHKITLYVSALLNDIFMVTA